MKSRANTEETAIGLARQVKALTVLNMVLVLLLLLSLYMPRTPVDNDTPATTKTCSSQDKQATVVGSVTGSRP